VITTNEKKMMMPYEDFKRLKEAIKKPNGDQVDFVDDIFDCNDAQINIMPELELRFVGQTG
jgi:hypothetical protein